MTSTPSKLITELSQLLLLDELTIKEQIWPQLSLMKSSTEVSIYLEGLLGTSIPSKQFISSYTNSRFPSTSISSSSNKSNFPPPPQSNYAKPNNNTNNNSRSNVPNFNNRNQNNISQQQQQQLEIEQQRRALIEKEFEGSGGKVYLKHRDEDYPLGGGKKSRGVSPAGSGTVTPVYSTSTSINSNSTSSQLLPISKLNPALLKATTAVQPHNNSNSSKNHHQKGLIKEEEGLVPLSEKATMELLEIDRVLRTFEKGKGSVRECFCQARIHTLSQHTPICPKCALVICSLNLPISPCPSCLHSPLLSSSATTTFISSLHSRREIIIQQETLRIAREKVQEQAEKAAIRFPTLGMAGSGDNYGSNSSGGGNGSGGLGGGGRNYSNIAGSGPDLNDRIEKAYIEGVSLNGRSFGGSKPSTSSNNSGGGGRVLKLDMKTKKVKIQTKVVKKILKEVKQQEAAANGIILADVEDEEDEDEAGAGWFDEKDDGYQLRHTTSSNQQKKLEAAPVDRPFLNVTMDENSRPIWSEEIIQEEEEEVMIVSTLKGVSRGVPGAAKVEGEGKGDSKKKSRSKVKKGTGVV